MQFVLVLAAFLSALSAIHLTIAWRDWPPDGVEMDTPLTRTLCNAFGWAVLAMALIFAVRLFGVVWPLVALGALWAAMSVLRRRVSLVRLYRCALPAAIVGLACVLLLFQGVFGDSDFGLFRIFPPDR